MSSQVNNNYNEIMQYENRVHLKNISAAGMSLYVPAVKGCLTIVEYVLFEEIKWNNDNFSIGLIVGSKEGSFLVLLIGIMTTTMLLNNNLGSLLGDKLSSFKEVHATKFYACIVHSNVNSTCCVFHPSSVDKHKNNVSPSMKNVFALRFQTCDNCLPVRIKLKEFPEEHDNFQTHHCASLSKIMWNDILQINQITIKMLSSK